MLTINNRAFAKNDSEFVGTLFTNMGTGTACGYYKKTKRGIQLMNMHKKLFAFVVNNGYGEQFIVSAIRNDSTNNKIRYSYALSTTDERLLGLDMLSYSEGVEVAKNAIEQLS